jgi:hypothetical protein
MSAIGRLTAPALNLSTQYYDPGAHYNEVRDKLWGLGGKLEKPQDPPPGPK